LPPLIIVMFEAGSVVEFAGAAPLGAAWPAGALARGGSPLPLYEPELVPGAVEPVDCPVAEAGPIALPGIAGPDSPGYITVAPIPAITSGRLSCLAFW
jgi:hypothetical protein